MGALAEGHHRRYQGQAEMSRLAAPWACLPVGILLLRAWSNFEARSSAARFPSQDDREGKLHHSCVRLLSAEIAFRESLCQGPGDLPGPFPLSPPALLGHGEVFEKDILSFSVPIDALFAKRHSWGSAITPVPARWPVLH